jgi:Peptidase U49
VANEVFLTTIAWMLFHEHGHLANSHPMAHSAAAKQEEHEADLFATTHVLGGVSDYDIRFKRSRLSRYVRDR